MSQVGTERIDMTITKGESAYIKLAFENGKPTPARYTKTLKSSWDFVPDAERKQTISMYPIMISGALGSDNAMHDYLMAKRDEHRRSVLDKASAFVKKQRAKMSQVGTSTNEEK
jgi:hypothetical protein